MHPSQQSTRGSHRRGGDLYDEGTCAKLYLQEFDSLAEEANIYKLVGPVLLKQEKTEAVMAVDGRLEFIDNEMYDSLPPRAPTPTPPARPLFQTSKLTRNRKRTEKQIADIQASSDAKRSEVRFTPSHKPPSAISLRNLTTPTNTPTNTNQIIALQQSQAPQQASA